MFKASTFNPTSLFHRRRAPIAGRGMDPYVDFQRDMNRLFDDFFDDLGAPAYFTGDRSDFARPVFVVAADHGRAIELQAELPGVDEADVDVEIQGDLLTIRGATSVDEDRNGAAAKTGVQFHRSITLPFDVDPDAVTATFKNGVLTLSLPKPPEVAATGRKIAINKT